MNRAQRRAAAKRQRTTSASRKRRVILSSGALLGAGAGLLPATPATAAETYVVNDPGDSGESGDELLTLREAVQAANLSEGLDQIAFAPGLAEIQLTNGDIGITDDVRIYDAEGDVVVNAQGNSRIFYSGTGELGSDANVTIEGLSLVNGDADQDDDDAVVGDDVSRDQGGAISMYGGSLTLIDVEIADSHADEGGAIGVERTVLSIIDSTLEGNTADYDGGAIFATDVSGSSSIVGTTIAGNAVGDYELQPATGTPGEEGYTYEQRDFVGYDGGGVWFSADASDLTITGSTISGNDAPRGGGGVYFSSSYYGEGEGVSGSGDLVVSDTIVDGNRAGYFAESTYGGEYSGTPGGGGIAAFSQVGSVTVTGGAVSGNQAFRNESWYKYSGSSGIGGGIFVVADTTITGVSIVDNEAGKYGGGIAAVGYGEGSEDAGSLTISGGEISGNRAASGAGVSAASVGDLTLQSTDITGNDAVNDGWFGYGGGGGVSVKYLRGDMTVDDTTISGNVARGSGGGVSIRRTAYDASVSFTGSTVSGNTAGTDGEGGVYGESGADGGGIHATDVYSPFVISDSTVISENVAADDGGGVYFGGEGEGGPRSLDLEGSAVSGTGFTLVDSAITGNSAAGGNGGGLAADGLYQALALTDVQVTGNAAHYYGGGIALYGSYNGEASGDVAITRSDISGNTAGHIDEYEGEYGTYTNHYGQGGGISLDGMSSTVTVTETTIVGNTSEEDGGGIGLDQLGGVFQLVDSTVDGNTAVEDDGGGIYADDLYSSIYNSETYSWEYDYGRVEVSGTTISNNHAGDEGGGVHMTDGDAPILFLNSTISSNSAAETGGGLSLDGGEGGTVENEVGAQDLPDAPVLSFTTISGNSVGGEGEGGGVGGLYLDGGDVYLDNSVVANSAGGDDIGGEGTFNLSFSLIENPGDASINDTGGEGSSSILGVDPQLGPLADNGGLTLTHLPQSGSPLINAGDPDFQPPPETDQRDAARVQGGRVDIGSVETTPPSTGGGGGAPQPTGPSQVQLGPDVVVNEDVGTATITVVRSGTLTGTTTVAYSVAPGQNASTADFGPTSGTLTFAPGESSKTISVPIVDDDLDEPDELLTVTLTNPQGSALGTRASGAITIKDDDGNIVCPDPATTTFGDVAGTNVHSPAIACLQELGIAQGDDGEFSPAKDVTRAQMASFIARVIEEAGGTLPSGPPDAFDDDDGTFHEPRINQLAAADVIDGFPDGTFRPNAKVTRGQMAKFIASAYAYITGEELPTPSQDFFDDDDGSTHELDINRIAAAEIVRGFTDGTYRPNVNVRRDQMASFLLNLLIEVESQD